jgi:hypothetical protein
MSSGAGGWNGQPMKRRLRAGAMKPSIRKTVWSRARWSGSGRPRLRPRRPCAANGSAPAPVTPCA